MNEYENVRRLKYGEEGATFIPICGGPRGIGGCGRFVKADRVIWFGDGGLSPEPNATCAKCGRVQMLFEGFLECDETGAG